MNEPIPINMFPEIAPRLNVAEIDIVDGAAGPGRRLVVWVQGCLKRCPGCANGPFLPLQPGATLSIDELLAAIDTVAPIDGITLSGGEPVLQAGPLLPFLHGIRRRGLTVFCYSGYTYDELNGARQSPELHEFLAHLDWLVDGEYERQRPRGGLYLPSSNQRLYRFSEGEQAPAARPAETECVLRQGIWTITGTLPEAVRRRMDDALRGLGLSIFSPRT